MYEHRRQSLLPRRAFYRRLGVHVAAALTLLVSALSIGVLGYHATEGLSWLDSLLNASMILGGMGPIGELRTTAGKLFASGYALFSGIFFLAFASILMAPIAHRFFHKFHLDSLEDEAKQPEKDLPGPHKHRHDG